jgi:hypothetical protein
VTRGPRPKPNAVRRNHHPHARQLLDEQQDGRELPKALGVQTAGARRFWRTWASAPQTQAWAETDWAELEITTVLVDRFFLGDTRVAGEVRQRVSRWGATVEDRARLRMTLVDPADDEPQAGVADQPVADLDEELYRLLNE